MKLNPVTLLRIGFSALLLGVLVWYTNPLDAIIQLADSAPGMVVIRTFEKSSIKTV